MENNTIVIEGDLPSSTNETERPLQAFVWDDIMFSYLGFREGEVEVYGQLA